MATGKRISTIIMAKINKILRKAENPVEELDYSYEKQLELLNNVKKAIADMATAKNQLEGEKLRLCKNIIDVDEQAKELLKQENETLAREVLERRVTIEEHIDSLTNQIKKMREDQTKLIEKGKVIEIRVEQFRSSKETMKAQYSAAHTSAKISESITGLDDSAGNAGDAMRRAEEKTQTMNARSSAIGELVDAGVLDDSLGSESRIDREVNKSKRKGKVDSEVERLKRGIK